MTFFFEPGMASMTLQDDSLVGSPTVFDTNTPMPHIVAELTGSFLIPDLNSGYVSSWGLHAYSRNETILAGTVDPACTFVTGACKFTSNAGSNFPTIDGAGWIMAGGSFVYDVKSFQLATTGEWTVFVTNLCVVSFEVNSGNVNIHVQSVLGDGFRTFMVGSTVEYKLFAGFFS